MTGDNKLLSDQVFQLNTLLWALQGLPQDGPVEPVLRRAGYYLAAIGRRVLVPSDQSVLASLAKFNGTEDRSPCHPDLWIRHATDTFHPVVELKSRSFSTDSSNSKQARKLIVSAVDLAASLAAPESRKGHVIYATGASDSPKLASTLMTLASELQEEGVITAPTAVLGFAEDQEGIHLMSPVPQDLPGPAAEALATPAIVLHREDKNDLRPLYFVPWMPGIKDSQDSRLHAEGLRELTARLMIHTLAEVGQAQPPTDLVLNSSRLLRSATYGVFDRWHDTDRKLFIKRASDILLKTLKAISEVNRESNDVLTIDLPNTDVQDSIIDRLRNTDPADRASNLEAASNGQTALF